MTVETINSKLFANEGAVENQKLGANPFDQFFPFVGIQRAWYDYMIDSTYFVMFYPEPMPNQTLGDAAATEARFIEEVTQLHPESEGKPCVIGNCQAGWGR